MSEELFDISKSLEMFEHAQQVIPNGIFGPRNPNFMVGGQYPCFFREGYMGHATDVDGNEYIDFMCSFGANLLGYRHPVVEEAVKEQMTRGGLMTMPMDRWVEAADYITQNIPLADWVIFAKNGSDVTTWCTRVARVHTKRKKILMASGTYHGFHDWCVPTTTGVNPAHRADILGFEFNNVESLKKAVENNKDEIAGIILTPMRHEAFSNVELPKEGFFDAVREVCDENGIVFIMDDIRCCFRLKFEGSHEYFGAKPDLVTIGKGITNGYPLSVAYGKEDLKRAACNVFFSGTHFYSGIPMAAAVAALKYIKEENVLAHINKIGEMFKNGIIELAEKHSVDITYSGPPAIPFVNFNSPNTFQMRSTFCSNAVRRGVFLHPHHNWFICGGHTEDDIAKTMEVLDICFEKVKELQ
ncbi:MAG TPA: aminotransferase class III-fold pyridoxal phosphate-dependent enzyme [bacterium]|nr:aminotransferase class III-fold pyridoxal phosphate-dependent enzyme [bacterium]